jgi:peptidoglycan/xylan/chitin deacetylase (PgdA/CDA1 family)
MSDRGESGVRLPVLVYHHVGPPRSGTHPALTVSPERFDSQLRSLARGGFSGVSSLDWLRWLDDGKPLPPRPILLTFDDGYADLGEFALPALARLGWRATVFVAASTVGGRSAWDEPEATAHPIMSTDDIRNWVAQGIEFGAHGATHRDITRLDSDRRRDEVLGARETLAELVGGPVTAFAYPYGSYNDEVRELVGSWFGLAFGLDEGLNDAATDRTRLRRTMVQRSDMALDLALRTRLGWSPLERVRARVRARERARGLGDAAIRRATGRRPSRSSQPSRPR